MIIGWLKNSRFAQGIVQLGGFLRNVDISPPSLLLPSLMTLGSALAEGASLALLVPTVKGVLNGDFAFIENTPVLNHVISFFPGISSSAAGIRGIFALLAVLIFIAVVLQNVLQYLAALNIFAQVRRASNRLRKVVYGRYLKFGKLYFDQENVGHLHQVLATYTSQVANELQKVHNVLYLTSALAVYSAIMLSISWKLTLMIVTVFPFVYILLTKFTDRIKSVSKSFSSTYSSLGKNISNALVCIPLIKAYTNEDKEEDRFASISDHVEKLEFKIDRLQALIMPVQEILMFTLFLLLVAAVGLIVPEQSKDIGGFIVFLFLLRRSMVTFGFLNQARAHFASVHGQIRELKNVLDDDGKYFVQDGTREFGGLREGVELNSLNFMYPSGLPAIRDVRFSIYKGQMTAIVGPSGSGKTTLINLLMRFYDCAPGMIKVDGTDIRDFTLKSLRSKIALVSQETLLLNASLLSNLKYGLDGQVGDDEVIAAAREARLFELIEKLPEGIETEIGDRGVKLSGGEKQRVAIARAILKRAEILILDEATSALDTATERHIQAAIEEVVRGRTTVVIAHRLSTIKNADNIIVIENGRVVEEGSLNALLEKRGRFFEYWEEQKFKE